MNLLRALAAAAAFAAICLPAGAQDAQDAPAPAVVAAPDGSGQFLINLRDATLASLAEQVSEITGRTLVLDPTVAGTVTVIASEPLDVDEVWEMFQSVLASNGFAALPSGSFWRVVPQSAVREGGSAVESPDAAGRLDVITRLVPLRNFPAATAANALRPLVASFGYIETIPETNTLVITDTSENVRRVEAIARRLDNDTEIVVRTLPVRNAVARDVAVALQGILAGDGARPPPAITVDDRANVILLRGTEEDFADAGRLLSELDVPGRPGPSVLPVTRVYALRFADAGALAEILANLVSGGAATATNPVAAALPSADPAEAAPIGAEGAGDAPPPVASFAAEDITIQPDLASNAIVVRAREEVQADLAALIQQLDTRRPQVLIEAAIVEISGDISEQLGVQLGFGGATPPAGFAATSFSGSGPALDGILRLLGAPSSVAVAPAGLSLGLARGDKFGLLLQALGQSNKARLLSTPSLTTLDNQPAEIVVGQNVPFRTGSFDRGSGGQTSFTTIERRDVGITMRVTPRVTDGNTIQLNISQEVSSLIAANVAGAADLITNRRSIETTVLSDNGGTVVLGGLITDDRQSARSEVPGLGRVPVIGNLFRSRQEQRRRQTLFVFMRSTVIRDGAAAAEIAADRVQRLRAVEAGGGAERSLLAPPRQAARQPVEIDGLY
jgi:general secretion pathway protein D